MNTPLAQSHCHCSCCAHAVGQPHPSNGVSRRQFFHSVGALTAGSMMLPEYIRLGRTYPNAFLELCFSACPRNLVENLVAVGLEDKVVWGSDVIFMDSTQQIGRVIFAKIPYETKLKIIGLNAIHALRLG